MRPDDGAPIRGLTLDLDDTLWPIWPAIRQADADLHAWLGAHAPATAERFDTDALRGLRDEVVRDHPQWVHDLGRIRQAGLARALTLAGDDPALAAPAFEVFTAGRNRVRCFDDALPALRLLAARWPIVALTNGNADLERVGIAGHFTGSVSAHELGVGKPDPRMFHEGCRRLGAAPHEVLHIGDNWTLDVVGAERAGLRSAWVCRGEAVPTPPDDQARPVCVARDMTELADWLISTDQPVWNVP